MFKERGQKATVEAINDKNGPFRKGDLYVFAITMDNQLVGHHDHTLRGIKFNKSEQAPIVKPIEDFSWRRSTENSDWRRSYHGSMDSLVTAL